MQVEFILLILSLLFFVSIVADKIGYKFGVPALLLFLGVGMLFGAGGVGSFVGGTDSAFDTDSAQALSTVALCIILFSGGMDTKLSDIKSVLAPGITLATLGVLVTCLLTGVTIRYVIVRPPYSLGISRMMSRIGIRNSSASSARWLVRIVSAARCMAGKPLRVSWFA